MTDVITSQDLVTAFGFEARPGMWKALVDRIAAYRRPVTIWAAGCAIGCEPYTLAMALHEAGITKARILASDMNPERVKLAADARYLACEVDIDVAMGRLPDSWRARYFEDAGEVEFTYLQGRYATVRPIASVRDMVEYAGALRMPDVPIPDVDVALMRNIWAHISPAERLKLYRRLYVALPADGVVAFRLAYFDEVARHMPRLDHPCLFGRPTVKGLQAMDGDTTETTIEERAPDVAMAVKEFHTRMTRRAAVTMAAMRRAGLSEAEAAKMIADLRRVRPRR